MGIGGWFCPDGYRLTIRLHVFLGPQFLKKLCYSHGSFPRSLLLNLLGHKDKDCSIVCPTDSLPKSFHLL